MNNLYLKNSSKIILWTIILAFIFNLLPLDDFIFLPDILLLLLIFWSVNNPNLIGLSTGFFLGLFLDVLKLNLLGQHSLIYILAIFLAQINSQRLKLFSSETQAIQLLPLFIFFHALELVINLINGGLFPGFKIFLAPIFEVLIWILISNIIVNYD